MDHSKCLASVSGQPPLGFAELIVLLVELADQDKEGAGEALHVVVQGDEDVGDGEEAWNIRPSRQEKAAGEPLMLWRRAMKTKSTGLQAWNIRPMMHNMAT